jgi:hypothetical protein
MTRRAAIAMVCALGLTAGCGGSGSNDPAGSGDEQKSPLAEYMGGDFTAGGGMVMKFAVAGDNGNEQPTEEQLAQQRRMEDLIATCMRDQGFEYVPVPPEAKPKSKFAEAFELPPDKFAEQYGYGISTFDWGDPVGENDTDPNRQIRDRLSATAKKAYDKALDGEGMVVAAGGGAKVSSSKSTDLGCRGKAAEQVYGKPKDLKDPGQEMRRFDSLFKDLEALRKRIEADPRVADAAQAWSDCMADARYTGLNKPEDARTKVQQRMDRLLGIDTSGPGPTAKPKSPKDLDPAQLSALKRYELAIAKADYDCKQTHYEKPFREVQFQLETEFVGTHRTLLEQYKEWAGQQKGPR